MLQGEAPKGKVWEPGFYARQDTAVEHKRR